MEDFLIGAFVSGGDGIKGLDILADIDEKYEVFLGDRFSFSSRPLMLFIPIGAVTDCVDDNNDVMGGDEILWPW